MLYGIEAFICFQREPPRWFPWGAAMSLARMYWCVSGLTLLYALFLCLTYWASDVQAAIDRVAMLSLAVSATAAVVGTLVFARQPSGRPQLTPRVVNAVWVALAVVAYLLLGSATW
jgi:hypothetical protein